jgi:hypothetical protein
MRLWNRATSKLALRAAGHYFRPLLDEHGYRKLFLSSNAED